MKLNVRKIPTAAAMFLPVVMYAQKDAASILNEMNSQIKMLVSPLYTMVMTVIIVLGMVSLVMVAVKMNSADQNASNKALTWFGVLVFCLVAAVVMKSVA